LEDALEACGGRLMHRRPRYVYRGHPILVFPCILAYVATPFRKSADQRANTEDATVL
jgi:hypothetical protein